MGGITKLFVDGVPSGRAQRSLKQCATRAVLSLLPAAVSAACAIHPVQQDVTGVPSKAIVDRIRCEARLAVLDKAIDVLRRAAEQSRTAAPILAGKFDVIVDDLERQRGGAITFDPRRLPTDRARLFYGRYIN